MDMSLYRKALSLKKEKKPKPAAFSSAKEEADWTFGSDYNYATNIVYTPYGSYRDCRFRTKSVTVSEPHGDHHSFYPYAVTRTLGRGIFYHEWKVEYTPGGGFDTFGYGDTGGIGGRRTQQTYKDAITRIKSVAQAAMGDQILRDRESWDVLVDLAELRETSSFLRETGESLVHIFQGIVSLSPRRVLKGFRIKPTRANVRHVRQVFKRYQIRQGVADSNQVVRAASNLWLSYRYGLMPLIYSTDDAAVAFSAMDTRYAKVYQVTIPDSGKHYSGTAGTTKGRASISEETTCFYNISCRLRAVVDYSEALSSRLGSNPWTPVITAYELITLSFVLDWFYDIGGWLERLRLLDITGSIRGEQTIKEKAIGIKTMKITPYGYGYSQWVSLKALQEPFFCEERVFTRSSVPLTSPPPMLSWGLDKWKRQVDSVALATSFLQSYYKGRSK